MNMAEAIEKLKNGEAKIVKPKGFKSRIGYYINFTDGWSRVDLDDGEVVPCLFGLPWELLNEEWEIVE